jgi:hypothetical protein
LNRLLKQFNVIGLTWCHQQTPSPATEAVAQAKKIRCWLEEFLAKRVDGKLAGRNLALDLLIA